MAQCPASNFNTIQPNSNAYCYIRTRIAYINFNSNSGFDANTDTDFDIWSPHCNTWRHIHIHPICCVNCYANCNTANPNKNFSSLWSH